ncbi:hypothetical protein [Chitinophaga qingshengii]|uniref:DUF3500 domain-containing protein n=1 Tax=Chitinophaga qingshengii TaxID=1569794 RepID=A0ABR7TTH3_9BACT|nr:hypothetical protein [Chitinophaga qingshengii]MBC9932756.1 hypothetical protein [Chitinophaga qingshengii]
MTCTSTQIRGLIPGVLLSIVLFAACNWGNKKTDNGQKKAKTDSLAHNQSQEPALATKAYVAELISRKKEIERQLPGISPEAAVRLYNGLALYVDSALTGITENEGGWLNVYVNYYSEEKNAIVLPDSVRPTVTLLATAGIEPWNIGEGYTELRTKPTFYTEIFKTSLPADYRSYLQLNADEDTVLYSADAGLMLPFSLIGQRALHWEQFLTTYPNSILADNARENFEMYCRDYLFGQDNTPSFDNHQEISSLIPGNKQTYLSFVQQHGNTKTGAIVKLFLDKLATEKSVESLRNTIYAEIRQVFIPRMELLPAQPGFSTAQVEQLTKATYDTVPTEEGSYKINRDIDSLAFFRQDGHTYCLATFRNGIPAGGGPATGWVDVWVFKNVDGNWQHTDHLLNAGGGGMYGNSGIFDRLTRLGTGTTGIVLSGGITHMGSNISWDDVLAFNNDQLTKAFSIVNSNAYDSPVGNSYCKYTRWSMQPVAQEDNYRLVIIAGNCSNAHNLPLEKTVVPFKNGYKIPEKFEDRGI